MLSLRTPCCDREIVTFDSAPLAQAMMDMDRGLSPCDLHDRLAADTVETLRELRDAADTAGAATSLRVALWQLWWSARGHADCVWQLWYVGPRPRTLPFQPDDEQEPDPC